jgi:hypothetical protein
MRTRLVLCAVLLAAGCVKRITPSPGEDRTTLSGVPLRFGQAQELPEGTTIIWDFGDGTPPQTGAVVDHAFPHGGAGVYTVVETVRDKDGQVRTARTHVVALRRSVPTAVPADVRAVLMMERPWERVQVHREVAGKLSLGAFFDEVARTVSEAAGFNALDPKAAAENGFDPDEGVAFFTVPQDPEALVFAVGTSDDGKSLAAAKRLLSSARSWSRGTTGPFQLSEAKLPDGTAVLLGQNAAGDKVAVLQRYGYLYLCAPGASDPLLALRSVSLLPPDKGLSADAGFLTASRQVGGGDALFYSRPSDSADTRYTHELGAAAFALVDQPELLQMRLWSQLKNLQGAALKAAFTPARPPPDIAARLPPHAAAYLRLSAAPGALWHELTRASGADAARLRDRVADATGLDVEKDLLPSFTGNVGIAVYLDASSLIEAILGEQVGSFDKSAFLVAAELSNPDTVNAALERAMKSRPASDRAQLGSASYYRLGEGAQAAVKDGFFFLDVGGASPQDAADEAPGKKGKGKSKGKKTPRQIGLAEMGPMGDVLSPGTNSLGRELRAAGLRGFDVMGQQDLWVDFAGIAKAIERAGSEQGGMAGQGARLFAERAASLRDALFETRPSKDGSGMDADLWVRFLPRKSAATSR